MKIGILPDLHLTDKTPKHRIDDYPSTQYWKLNWCLNTFKDQGASIVLQPGDLCDSHKTNNFVKQLYIPLLLSMKPHFQIFTVYGQHDMRFHSTKRENTPLRVIESAGAVEVIPKGGEFTQDALCRVSIYGASWDEDIPTCEINPDNLDILVAHKMVVNEKLWAGQDNFTYANILLISTKFDLIVTGDNHQAFWAKDGDRHLINCGSLMRSTSIQMDHKPMIGIYDTFTKALEVYYIPIKPIEEVMDVKEIEEEKVKNLELESFVSTLQGDANIQGLNFLENLWEYAKANQTEEGIIEILKEVTSDA